MWVGEDLIRPDENSINDNANVEIRTSLKSPLEYFYSFFDSYLIDLITSETNRYAMQKNETQMVSETDLRALIGVLFLSGYVPLPRRKIYWERERDAHNEQLVTKAISRDKFDFVMKNIHFQDNNHLDTSDKFAKIRPLFQHLNKTFLEHGKLELSHSVDEAMFPYYGRHGAKQFMKGKPIRDGYKLWMGTSRLGYVYWFEPYQGISTNISVSYAEYGVGAGVVLEYADAIRKKWPVESIHLFFDNIFTSIPLIELLTQKKFYATGTVRENRLPDNPLVNSKSFKKEERGSYDYKKISDQNIVAVKWNDNSLVNLCSNYAGIEPIHNVK